MRLATLYVRFYKSFNYDYERKFGRTSKPDEWELIDGAWFPYVRIDLEPSVTTIVGANESGKTHLLDAITKLITGKKIDRSDFCRYSHFFSVQQGERRLPDFGGEFEVITSDDTELANKHLKLDMKVGERFRLFRPNGESPVIYHRSLNDPTTVDDENLKLILPSVFRLDAHVPLPVSIPLHELASRVERPYGSRHSRRSVFKKLLGKQWKDVNEVTKAAPELYSLLSDTPISGDADNLDRQYKLGQSLLFDVAEIESTTFEDLAEAIADERKEGYVNGLIQNINKTLARYLNFPRWWAQDREFQLMVSPREHELVFTVRDRTGTDYSFAERSNGLRFFLSYHVQLLAHHPPGEGQSEILLMDEPDAYLSSQGQEDLLRILEGFALPEDGSRRDQIVYVTHSPFLINRNAGERIRVLDKGVTDEGSRVVKDVARNHYEPLRSSLGAFVAETSFIGGLNLFVEGLADQILLAGVNSHLLATGASKKTTLLDLNDVTIVPAGSASSVPYLIYLARGRDVIRPPCVVLLDSDDSGDEAVKVLARGGARRKMLLPSKFVVQVGSWAKNVDALPLDKAVIVRALEDLIPLPVAVEAARNYASTIIGLNSEDSAKLVLKDVTKKLANNKGSVFKALRSAFTERFGAEFHIEKVGFAKEVVAVLSAWRSKSSKQPSRLGDLERSFGLLLADLAKHLREARRCEEEKQLTNRLYRTVDGFLADHPTPTTRARGKVLVEEVEASADDSVGGDRVKGHAARLRREFHLDENLTDPIEDYDKFIEQIEALRYIERLAKQKVNDGWMEEVAPEPARKSTDSVADKQRLVSDGTSADGPDSSSREDA